MTTKTKAPKKQRMSIRVRLGGSKPFTLGPYKSTHVAHSYASQVRRIVKTKFSGWTVTTNVENNTIRVAKAAK